MHIFSPLEAPGRQAEDYPYKRSGVARSSSIDPMQNALPRNGTLPPLQPYPIGKSRHLTACPSVQDRTMPKDAGISIKG